MTFDQITRINKITEESCQPIVDWVCGRLNEAIPPCSGTGIVMCAGGRYLREAFVTIRVLRSGGCTLPIEMWHLGPKEIDDRARNLFGAMGVELVDAFHVEKTNPMRRLGGWQCKPFAVKHSRFQHVLLIDADSHPLRPVEEYFDSYQYKSTGCILFPDIKRNRPHDRIFPCLGLKVGCVDEHESGQILIDKHRHWRAICLTVWMNSMSDFFYKMILGDKDTWGLAFTRLGVAYSQAPKPTWGEYGNMTHYWFDGQPAFNHFLERKRNRNVLIPPHHQAIFEEYDNL